MRTALLTLLALALLAACASLPGGLTSPDPALASHGRICGAIPKGGSDYLVVAKRIGCRKGRKGVQRYLDTGKPLRGFNCKDDRGKYAFVCQGPGVKSYRAERL